MPTRDSDLYLDGVSDRLERQRQPSQQRSTERSGFDLSAHLNGHSEDMSNSLHPPGGPSAATISSDQIHSQIPLAQHSEGEREITRNGFHERPHDIDGLCRERQLVLAWWSARLPERFIWEPAHVRRGNHHMGGGSGADLGGSADVLEDPPCRAHLMETLAELTTDRVCCYGPSLQNFANLAWARAQWSVGPAGSQKHLIQCVDQRPVY